MLRMPSAVAASADLTILPPEVAALIERLQQQAQADAQELARRGRELTLAQAKIDKLNFELARLRRWQFDARTEAMTAAQRLLFAEALAEDEASLRAKLAALQAGLPEVPKTPKAPRRQPRRQALPEHLERVEHRHEPDDTTCPTPNCGQPMQRIGEDVSEKLDIVPAKFFVHRHIYGKWACRCCQLLRQEPAEPDVVDGGIPAAGLVAHTLISRFVDHLPYYRQEPINARSGVHTPRSTLASWGGAGGASLEPLYELHRSFILGCRVLHADETPVPLLDPGAGKTKKAYVWAWARSHHDPHPGVIYEFCLGRGAQYPLAFLGGKGPPSPEPAWHGTLITDQYAAYNAVLDTKLYPQRKSAACAAHARRRFEELSRGRHSASAVAAEAMQRLIASLSIGISTAVRALGDADAAERKLAETVGREFEGFEEMVDERRNQIELDLRRQLEYQLIGLRETVEKMKPYSPLDKQTTRILAEPRVLEAHPNAVVDVSSSHLVRVTLPKEEIADFLRQAERDIALERDVLDDDWFR